MESATRSLRIGSGIRRCSRCSCAESPALALAIWDGNWNTDSGAVLFAALVHFWDEVAAAIAAATGISGVAAEWIDPIASWAHADDLTRLYSSALAAAPVIPVLRTWSLARDQ